MHFWAMKGGINNYDDELTMVKWSTWAIALVDGPALFLVAQKSAPKALVCGAFEVRVKLLFLGGWESHPGGVRNGMGTSDLHLPICIAANGGVRSARVRNREAGRQVRWVRASGRVGVVVG